MLIHAHGSCSTEVLGETALLYMQLNEQVDGPNIL